MLFPSSFAVSRRAKLSQLVDFASHMAHNSPTRFHKERKRKSKLTSNLNAIEGIQTNARVYRIKKYFDASHSLLSVYQWFLVQVQVITVITKFESSIAP